MSHHVPLQKQAEIIDEAFHGTFNLERAAPYMGGSVAAHLRYTSIISDLKKFFEEEKKTRQICKCELCAAWREYDAMEKK